MTEPALYLGDEFLDEYCHLLIISVQRIQSKSKVLIVVSVSSKHKIGIMFLMSWDIPQSPQGSMCAIKHQFPFAVPPSLPPDESVFLQIL